MFKKTMTFEDLEGNEVTETFRFNYNKLELGKLLGFYELEKKIEMLQTPTSVSGLSEVENAQMAFDTFEFLIAGAYGIMSDDKRSFDKSPEITRQWKNHVAFTELIFEFIENPDLAGEFITECFPEKMVKEARAQIAKDEAANPTPEPEEHIETGGELTGTVTPLEEMTDGKTDAEILKMEPQKMTPAQLLRGFQLKSGQQ